MRVLFDHQIFSIQNYGGISRYFIELYKAFLKSDFISPSISIKYSNNVYLKECDISTKSLLGSGDFKGKKVILQKINALRTNKTLIRANFDIFHPTYYEPYFIKNLGNKPFAITIHDLTHELFPSKFSRYDHTKENRHKLLSIASKIIAVSENTKNDLIYHYNISPDKISVIYHGYNDYLKDQPINSELSLPNHYLLYIGNRGRYKNFGNYIKSISMLLKKEKDLFIVCAGGGAFSKAECEFFSKYDIFQKVLYYPITHNNLKTLFNSALAFVFPSLYEGFGMPVLEAFSCDCPVIASNTSSLPEVGGDAALYFEPTNRDSMLDVSKKIIENQALRNHLINNGKKRLKKFSWDKTALQTIEHYKSLL